MACSRVAVLKQPLQYKRLPLIGDGHFPLLRANGFVVYELYAPTEHRMPSYYGEWAQTVAGELVPSSMFLESAAVPPTSSCSLALANGS